MIRQPLVYTVVGGCVAIANNLLIIALSAHMHYLMAATLSFLIITPCAFMLHCRFTYCSVMIWLSFVRYAAGALLMFPAAIALLALLCGPLALPVAIGVPLATLILFVCNFIIARWAILRRAL